VSFDALSPSTAAPGRVADAFAPEEPPPPTIDAWSVVGHDRIVGILGDGTSSSHGKKIITSPVLRVQLAVVDGARIAHTQSGSRYLLATPAPAFGAARAEQFVRFKCSVPRVEGVTPADAEQTGLLKLQA
jgi:hypothetical protein